MNNINFEEDQQDLVDKTATIQSLADQIQLLEGLISRIEKSENNLKDLKKEHDRLSGEVIPTMMAEMGLAHLKLSDGSTVDVKPNYSASISIANREKAFTWLRENGLGDIIKNENPYHSVVTRITRQLIMLLLQRNVGFNRHKS